MRDPQRIDRIVNQLRDMWKVQPDTRLGQLLLNAMKPGEDLYFVEDDQLIEKLRNASLRALELRWQINK